MWIVSSPDGHFGPFDSKAEADLFAQWNQWTGTNWDTDDVEVIELMGWEDVECDTFAEYCAELEGHLTEKLAYIKSMTTRKKRKNGK